MTKVVKVYLISKMLDADGKEIEYEENIKSLWDSQKRQGDLASKSRVI